MGRQQRGVLAFQYVNRRAPSCGPRRELWEKGRAGAPMDQSGFPEADRLLAATPHLQQRIQDEGRKRFDALKDRIVGDQRRGTCVTGGRRLDRVRSSHSIEGPHPRGQV
jgi:hypothetical protein